MRKPLAILGPKGTPARSSFAVQSVQARYDAAWWSPTRSVVPTWLADPKKDMIGYERRELMRKSWHYYCNSPFARALIERLVTYTVGTGINGVPASSNPAWNVRAEKVWNQWIKFPDLQSRATLPRCQRTQFRGQLIFGDAFTLKTFGESGRPRVQLIEGMKIYTFGSDDRESHEGVLLDKRGRPSGFIYNYRDNNDENHLTLAAEEVVQHYFPERPGQLRGMPILASALNTVHDIDDILALEKQAVKDGSSHTDIIKTGMGEISLEELQANGGNINIQGLSDQKRYYETSFGAEAKILKPGDEWESYVSQRPSPAWQGFMDFLVQSVTLSTGIPPSVLLQLKVGGADTRRDLATAQRVFEVWQQDIAAQWQEVYEHVIEAEIQDGSLGGAPPDWRSADWFFPRSITVDAGRDAKADMELMRMGKLSSREYHGNYGDNWRKYLREIAEEKSEKYKLAEEFGIPVWELELLNVNQAAPAPDPNAQMDPEENATEDASETYADENSES